jgi:hypothetical protein
LAQFQDIPADRQPFLRVVQDAVTLLESVTAAEKAQAVPYLLIWQVDPNTGLPVNASADGTPRAPLSLRLVEPPRFGSSVDGHDVRYRERPPVSLVKVSVKTENPRGVINYRQVEISFMVHRPDALFGRPDDGVDSWSSLLLPGAVHAMEYGWRASTGVKNGLLNGEGFVDQTVSPPVIIPATTRIRFATTHYDFGIQPDGQISINATAFEDSEFNLRRTVPGLSAVLRREDEQRAAAGSKLAPPAPVAVSPYEPDGKKVLAELQRRVSLRLRDRADGKGFVTFRDLCDVLFADAITDAYTQLGYDPPQLFLGNLNDRCGRTAPKYGGDQLSGKSVGEFRMPLGDVEKRLGSIMRTGEQLTFYNLVGSFLSLFQDPRAWDTRLAKKGPGDATEQTVPQVAMRSVISRKAVALYVFDVKREFARFSPTDRFTTEQLGAVTREQVRKKLADRGVPVISFFRGNSYVESADFKAIGDDPIKSILMRRALRPDRQAIQDAGIKLKEGALVDPRQLLYSSAIHGDVTMLGNFAFDLFALVWLEFGVPQWDGPFFVQRRQDDIGPGEFRTTLSVYSAGDDPLGTQGRFAAEQAAREAEAQRKATDAKQSSRPSRKGL